MSEKIREVSIEFKPTEPWRRLAPEYEIWYAWTQADNEWQIFPKGIKVDEENNLEYGSEVYCPEILTWGIGNWLERLFVDSRATGDPSPENRLSFFCDQLLKAGVAAEIVKKNVWTFEEQDK